MSNNPTVTIITPYYNTGLIFHETVASVLAQSIASWEWVIVDDGSTDQEAIDVLADVATRGDGRISIIRQQNLGLPSARNTGIAHSRAELLFFLDSDDLISPTALEKLSYMLASDIDASFVTSWSTAFGAESFLWRHGFDDRATFPFENMVAPLVMVRKALFDTVGLFDPSRTTGLEDYEFWLRCAAHGKWGRDIPEFLVHQRKKTAQEYRGYAWPARDNRREFTRFQRDMRSRYPEVYRAGVPHLPPLISTRSAPTWRDLKLTPRHSHTVLLAAASLDTIDDAIIRQLASQAASPDERLAIIALSAHDSERIHALEQTADIYILSHLMPASASPSFLPYFIASHGISQAYIAAIIDSPLYAAIAPYVDRISLLHTSCEYPQEAGNSIAHQVASGQQNYAITPQSYARHRLALLAFPISAQLRRLRNTITVSRSWAILHPLWQKIKDTLR